MKIICTGSIAYDYLMTFPGYFREHILPDKLDCISLSFLVDSMVRHSGGTAANIAYTLGLLGEHPVLFGTVGIDFEEYRSWLESKGVDTSASRVIPDKYTASFFATTDRSNAQLASFYPGAMAHATDLSLKDFAGSPPDIVVISPTEPAAMDGYVRECQALKFPYLYDPSQQIVRMDGEDIRRGVEGATTVFVNEYEFELLQKKTGMKLADILKHVRFLVVTLGEKGSQIYEGDKEIHIPVVKPETIADPTGVGDAFRSGFLKGYALGLDWQTCGQIGALTASYCLEKIGCQSHSFTLPEFVKRYRQNFDDHGKLDALLK